MNTQVAQMQVVNGVNVTDLVNTVGAVKEMPGLAKFKFRISNPMDRLRTHSIQGG